MTVAEQQKQVNDDISEELDKYQVMLEYGRLFLDKDKRIRSKYKWISFAENGCKTGVFIDIAITIIIAIFSSASFNQYMPYTLAFGVFVIFLYVLLLYRHRQRIAELVSEKDRKELEKLLNELQDYLVNLEKWLKEVDSHIRQNSKIIAKIKEDLAVGKSKQANNVNRISLIQGDLDEELDAKAHKMAEARLQPFIKYTYKYVQET